MSNFFLKVALPTSHIPKKILRVITAANREGRELHVYLYQEKDSFRAKKGPRKKDAYMQTCFWCILSSKPIKDYERRKW